MQIVTDELVERVARWLFRYDWPNTMRYRYYENTPELAEVSKRAENTGWRAYIDDAKDLLNVIQERK